MSASVLCQRALLDRSGTAQQRSPGIGKPEQLARVTQALEFVDPGGFEREARSGKQELRRGRDEHLAWHRNARDACGFMDGEAPYVVAYELDFARVNPGPDRNAQIGDRLTHGLGASNRSGGMRRVIFDERSRRPEPWQVLHGLSTTRPAP